MQLHIQLLDTSNYTAISCSFTGSKQFALDARKFSDVLHNGGISKGFVIQITWLIIMLSESYIPKALNNKE